MARTLALTLTLALWAPGMALADEEDLARSGFYVGGGLVLAVDHYGSDIDSIVQDNLEDRPSCPQPAGTNCVHRPLGNAPVDLGETGALNGQVGYRVLPNLAVEAEVEWVAFLGFESDERIEGGGLARRLEVDVDTLVATVNVKPYLLTGRFQPWVLVGAGVANVELDVKYDGQNDSDYETGFAMRFGGGVDFYATENVALTLKGSYLLPFGSAEDYDYFSVGMLGVTYRF